MFFAPIVLLLLTIAPQDAKADAPKLKAALEQAKQCADATIKGDIEKLADLTHPTILKMAGGKAKMVETVKKQMDDMKSKGFKFNESKVDPAKTIVKAKSGLYCILPTMTKISVKDQKIKLNSFLVGVSTDDGKTWKFLDGNSGEEDLRKVVPEIPKDLKFPAKVEPKVES